MALSKCRECGGQVSTEAEKCPHCGASDFLEKEEWSLINHVVGPILVVLVPALMCGMCLSRSGEDQTPWHEQDASTMAYIQTQDYVRERLPTPSTATFPDAYETQYKRDGQTYLIKAYVDHENQFGGTVRTHYVAKIEQVADGEWQLHDIQVGN